MTTDVENDLIYYIFDWGDGNKSNWFGPFYSGETVQCNYSWEKKGSYEIKVKAKDEHNQVSSWSDPLRVDLPKVKSCLYSSQMRLLIRLYFFLHNIDNINCSFLSNS